jgi:SAM-dependent methyltransferase
VETSHTVVEQRILAEAIPEGAVVLEAGCGRTTRLSEYRGRIARLVGIDLDTAAGRENPWLDEFVEADLTTPLPFDDGTFDLVYSNFVVEHLEDPAATFREFRRVLRPGGRLVILTSNRSNPLMAAADAMPERLRLLVKRRGAGAVERDVFPTRYRANTPEALSAATAAAGFTEGSVEYVATLHRYGARIPGAAAVLRAVERSLPERRRSTIVAAYRAPKNAG